MLKQRERAGIIYHVIGEEGRRGRGRWRRGSGKMGSEHIIQGREMCLMLEVYRLLSFNGERRRSGALSQSTWHVH